VSAASPPNKAFSGAISVTVSGLSFAAADLSPTAVVSTATCSTAAWTSATTVHCLSASGDLPSVVQVTVASAVGTGQKMFTFDGKRVARRACRSRTTVVALRLG